MKTPRFLLLLLAALFSVMTLRPVEARAEVSFDFFYDSLSPYGEWVQVADYGYCWRPTEVEPDWAPYSDGYWAYTDAGWTWVSYEDFGGIVYHYGRWVRVEDEGWCWVPDYEWGPAWVSWRNSDEYVGWAPLPPEARWQPSVGISVWVDRDYDIGPGNYNFCHTRDFGAPVLGAVIINRFENVTIIRRTVNITNITYNTSYDRGPVVYCGGPNFAVINQRSSRRIPALKLVQNVDIDMDGLRGARRGDRRINFNGRAEGNQLLVNAPVVRPPKDPGFMQPQIKKVFAADKVTRGWSGVRNDDVRKELKQEMNRQTKGLTRDTTPAKAVAVNDLKVLPAKADPKAPSPLTTKEQRDRSGRDGRDDKDRPDRDGKTPNVAGQPSGPGDGTDGRTKPGMPGVTVPNGNKDDKDRPGRDKNGKTPNVAGQPSGPGDGADGRTKPGIPGVTVADGNKDDKDRPGRDKNGKTPNVAGQPLVPGDGTDGRTKPGLPGTPAPNADDRTTGKGRGPMGRDGQKPGEPGLKPFNPVTETERKDREKPPGAPGTPDPRLTNSADDGSKMREAAEQRQRQAEIMRQQQEAGQAQKAQAAKAAEAVAQENNRKQAEGAAKMQQQQNAQRDALKSQQQQNDAAGRQRMQADQQEKAARAAAAQQKQAEMQRRQGDEQKAAEQQQRRQGMDQQKQRDAGEQARKAQDAQRDQMRQQFEAQKQAREAQRAQQPPPPPQQVQKPQGAPPSTEGDSDDKRKKKKD